MSKPTPIDQIPGLNYDQLMRDLDEAIVGAELTDQAASREIGIRQSTLSRISNGSGMSLSAFVAIVRWLGVTPERYIKPVDYRWISS